MVIVEIHLKFVEQLNAEVTMIVQAIKHVIMLFVLIHAYTIMFVHREPNVHHKIICQFVNAQTVIWAIHMWIVNVCHKLNVL